MAEEIPTSSQNTQSSSSEQSTVAQISTPQSVTTQSPTYKNKKGKLLKKIFLLIIFVVVATALAYFGFKFYKQWQVKQRDAQRKKDLTSIQQSLEKMRQKTQDQKYYPSAISKATLVDTKIMDKVPQDPQTNQPYLYQTQPSKCSNDCTSYTIYACLENKNDPQGIEPVYPCTTKSYKVSSK